MRILIAEELLMIQKRIVTPAQAGAQKALRQLDSGFRGNDGQANGNFPPPVTNIDSFLFGPRS